ncbi:nucleotidyltransferase family protein [Pseudooceanicola batsensis HTCC2597]|uniref:Nucleotidyltransferase family protein n=1 Tax=Pseudooceanicola batsensis (strain ATCC BAA-863 / DSM 15984 / KCTC 12145 / HTCC2597) TaxID=252305 RepID=A3TXV9_PSEBH|nr:nucleotidyltransferase family protein [Pseudooceanicola batsensis]EAQ02993.1 nucleotidyltransferase family protein [Pseudooceanicola batsensis HTCC2597]
MTPRSMMLFAAGFGTRMGALTADRPKPLIEVAGRPLIDHALAHARDVVPGPVVANLHYRADQLEAHLAGTGVRTLREEPEILETGGGLRNALGLLGAGPVWAMNSDAVWAGPNPLRLLREAWTDEMEALLLCVPPERAIGHAGGGDFVAGPPVRRGPGMIYTGAQIIRTGGLADIRESAFSLNLLWDDMLARGGLHVLSYPGEWCDVGRPEGIALAEEMLRRHV